MDRRWFRLCALIKRQELRNELWRSAFARLVPAHLPLSDGNLCLGGAERDFLGQQRNRQSGTTQGASTTSASLISSMIERSEIRVLEIPPITSVDNREAVIFEGATPLNGVGHER